MTHCINRDLFGFSRNTAAAFVNMQNEVYLGITDEPAMYSYLLNLESQS